MDRTIVPLYHDYEAQPLEDAEHARVLGMVTGWFEAADTKRQPLVDLWRKQYRMYRSWVEPRRRGDTSSRVFIPIAFHIVETEMPKLISSLPAPIVKPVGGEDVEPAAAMEERLQWCFDQSKLYVELQATYRSALKYGTGIMKIYPGKRVGRKIVDVPKVVTQTQELTRPVMDPETNAPLMDPDGLPVQETYEQEYEVEDGTEKAVEEFVYYQGPFAEAIDIEDIWVPPECSSIEDARYVIQRVWRSREDIERLIEEGAYALPVGHTLDALWEVEDSSVLKRQEEIGQTGGVDPDNEVVEVWECWTPTEKITVLGRKLVVCKAPSPFAHGMKPFVRIVDHFQEHEFYGVGELEPIRGIQDAINMLWNSRIDNVRLVLQRVFAVNPDNLYDLRDLRISPGSTIRVKGNGALPREVIMPLDFPDITGSSYEEVQVLVDMVERVLAVSAYQAGTDSPTLNQTATGVAIISEQGNDRFAAKLTMGELTGLEPLSYQFGSLLQQYAPPEMIARREGPEGAYEFSVLRPEDVAGAFDYTIETGSSTQTETMRKESAASLFNMLQGRIASDGMPLANDRELLADLLRAFGKKDVQRLAFQPPALPPGLEGLLPMMNGAGGMPPAPGAEQAPEPQGAA